MLPCVHFSIMEEEHIKCMIREVDKTTADAEAPLAQDASTREGPCHIGFMPTFPFLSRFRLYVGLMVRDHLCCLGVRDLGIGYGVNLDRIWIPSRGKLERIYTQAELRRAFLMVGLQEGRFSSSLSWCG